MVGSHVNGDLGAVYVVTDEGADWLSVVQRGEGGWAEVGGGDGGLVWLDTSEDTEDRGVLACVIPVDEPGDYLVPWADSSATVKAAGPYAVAVVPGVMADDRPRVTRLSG